MRLKEFSGNERWRKSSIWSGQMLIVRPSQSVQVSLRISVNLQRGSDLSHQIIRLPQHTSRM